MASAAPGFWMLVVVQFCFTFAVGGSFIHLCSTVGTPREEGR
jgi:hypothetical protein